MAQTVFQARKVQEGTWLISGTGCDSYLLEGSDEAFMIDSGMDAADIRAFAQTLTPLPVSRVINTHSHFDHTAGNGFFDVVYGTEGIARSAKNTMGANPADYRLDYTFTIVKDGDVIDLAGRPLRVIVLDCHAPGNLAVLDETHRILFPGDEIETGQVLLLPGYAEEPGQIHAKSAATAVSYTHLSHYDAVLFGSRVRAGMLAAEGLLKRILPAVEGKRTAVFAVGVLPPGAPGTEAVRSRIAAYGPRVFYLQGGVDYEKLGFCGRVLLKGMRGALSKKQERTPEEEAMVQALTNPPSRIDPQAAAPILEYIRGEG